MSRFLDFGWNIYLYVSEYSYGTSGTKRGHHNSLHVALVLTDISLWLCASLLGNTAASMEAIRIPLTHLV